MTTITPALLAEIKAKAEKGAAKGRMLDWTAYRPDTMLALLAALEEAKRERDAAGKAHNKIAAELTAAQTMAGEEIMKADALRTENDNLRAALKPFAIEAPKYDPPEGDEDELPYGVNITIGNLRHARSALKETTHAD